MKKITMKRLCIFLFISFALVWVPTIIFHATGHEYEHPAMHFILSFSMLCPSIGMLLARYFTNEGFSVTGENSMMLGISFRNKKIIFYILALTLPIIYRDLELAAQLIFQPQIFDTSVMEEAAGIPAAFFWLVPLSGIVSAVLYSIGAIGEEAGWRGYMMPKLESLFGTIPAVIIGGIIWGIWHFPANYMGHNFGTGYLGEPWSGFILFTLMTIGMNAMLTYLTKKSDSVWPAAFLHAMNNTGACFLSGLINGENFTGIYTDSAIQSAISLVPFVCVAFPFFVLLQKETHKSPKTHAADFSE